MTKLVLIFAAFLAVSARAQQAAPSVQSLPVYDVVTIKPNNTLSDDTSTSRGDTTFKSTNTTLKRLIAFAFGIRAELISGLPAWAESQHFDVNAKVLEPDMNRMKSMPRAQRNAMLAAVLADRFHLRTHFETKTLPVFELVVAKSGSKLTPTVVPDPLSGVGDISTGNGEMTASDLSISDLAARLSLSIDRNILDKTGLTGRYDFHLRWTPDDAASNARPDGPPALSTALSEQLGLSLQSAKGPVQTLVVDHVEQPTAN